MVKLWSGRGENLGNENRMTDESKELAAVIILRRPHQSDSEAKRKTKWSVFEFGSGY
jgi:hypothetical protein